MPTSKLKKIAPVILAILFVLSFFMPAYKGGYVVGWECAKFSLEMVSNLIDGELESIYFVFFNITSLLNVYFLIFLIFDIGKNIKVLKWIGGFLCIHLLSWPISHFLLRDISIKNIDVGYYLWACSIILVWILYVKSNNTIKT